MHRDARSSQNSTTAERALVAAPASPQGATRWLKRLAGALLLLCLLPVLLLGLVMAVPVALAIGGFESLALAWRGLRRHRPRQR